MQLFLRYAIKLRLLLNFAVINSDNNGGTNPSPKFLPQKLNTWGLPEPLDQMIFSTDQIRAARENVWLFGEFPPPPPPD